MRKFLFAAAAPWVGLVGFSSAALGGPVELDVEVGYDDNRDLAFPDFDFGKVILTEFANPPLPFLPDSGWVGDNPGWASLKAPEPGLFQLEPGASIAVRILSLSPALRMFDPAGGDELLAGDTWSLGGGTFDGHPIWVIDATSPAFNPSQQNWFGEFELFDAGTTNYGDSAVHSFRFGVPEPSSLALLALGAIAFTRRAR